MNSKQKVRALLGRNYFRLQKARHSTVVRVIAALARLPVTYYRQHNNGKYFAADICGDMGMGAILSHMVKLLRHAEIERKIPVVASISRLYSSPLETDCLAPYIQFKNLELPPPSALSPLRIRNEQDYRFIAVPRRLTILEAHDTFERHCAFRPVITDEVDKVMRSAGVETFDLSMHYRGTDKSMEAQSVSRENFISAVLQAARDRPLDAVFLATDDAEAEKMIVSALPRSRVSSYKLFDHLSGPRHLAELPGQLKAIEALVNILLLSRSPICIRTSSYMSAWSKILNPAMQTVTLNRTFDGSPLFPEHEVLKAEEVGR